MIIALNSKSTPVTEIPFPAVTICEFTVWDVIRQGIRLMRFQILLQGNMNNAKQSKVQNFKKGSFNEFLLEGLCNKRENLSSNDFSSSWPQFREFIINV